MNQKNSLPPYVPDFSEIAKQMRINVDVLKKEITQHVDFELARFKKEIEKMLKK